MVLILLSMLAFPSVLAQIDLEYQPMRPSYHPNPGNNIAQIVPTGTPWPANKEDSSTQFPSILSQVVPIIDRIKEDTKGQESQEKPQNPLEYQPILPSFHPKPGNKIEQIVPPGKPWPASPEDYNSFSQTKPPINLVDRIKEDAPTVKPTNGDVFSLEYQPNRPFYAGSGNLVPPMGEKPQIVDRFNELVSNKPINLEYQPNRPFFAGSGTAQSTDKPQQSVVSVPISVLLPNRLQVNKETNQQPNLWGLLIPGPNGTVLFPVLPPKDFNLQRYLKEDVRNSDPVAFYLENGGGSNGS